MNQASTIVINGIEHPIDVSAESSLLSFLRERLDLTGAKVSCGEGVCGACTVLVDGLPARACVTSLAEIAGREVVTIEGLARDGELHPLQRAFLAADAFQCGYCTPGMIMAGVSLLMHHPDTDEATIIAAMNGNLCRCGMYGRIVRAIRLAAAELQPTGARHE